MKKIIYIPVILLFALGVFLFLKPQEIQLEKLVIQTNFYPVKTIEMQKINAPGKARTLWVQKKNNKTKDILFNVDVVTLDAVLTKLNLTNDNNTFEKYTSGKKYLYGQQKKFEWLVEKQGASTYLKLISPLKYENTTANRGC